MGGKHGNLVVFLPCNFQPYLSGLTMIKSKSRKGTESSVPFLRFVTGPLLCGCCRCLGSGCCLSCGSCFLGSSRSLASISSVSAAISSITTVASVTAIASVFAAISVAASLAWSLRTGFAYDERKESHFSGSANASSDHSLLLGRVARLAGGKDLAAIVDEASKDRNILVIDDIDLVRGQIADLTSALRAWSWFAWPGKGVFIPRGSACRATCGFAIGLMPHRCCVFCHVNAPGCSLGEKLFYSEGGRVVPGRHLAQAQSRFKPVPLGLT